MTIITKQAQIAEASTADLVETYNALTGKSITRFSSRSAGESQVANAILAAENRADMAGVPKGGKGAAKPLAEQEAETVEKAQARGQRVTSNGAVVRSAPASAKEIRKTAQRAAKAASKKTAVKRGRAPNYDLEGNFRVGDHSEVKRGAYRQIVDAALSLGKVFKFAELEKKCAKLELSENQLRNTLSFGLRHGVFEQA